MNMQSFSAALMVVGLLTAAPTFAQTTQPQKQPAQESYAPVGRQYNADPTYTPTKQPTQEGGLTVSLPYSGASTSPEYKQK